MRKKVKLFFNILIDRDRKSLIRIVQDILELRRGDSRDISHYITCLAYKKRGVKWKIMCREELILT